MATALDHDAPMPEPRSLTLPLLPAGTTDDAAFRAFMRTMGDELAREIEVSPIPGVKLSVSHTIFEHHASRASKLDKRGRAAYVHFLSETIRRPDEAWLLTGDHGNQTLTLLARFLRGRDVFAGIAVFKAQGASWIGWSAYQTRKNVYIESLRSGSIIYRREP